MKTPFPLRLFLFLLGLASGANAQTEDDAALVSPDGRFTFTAFSSEDVDAGKKPAFGIVEIASGKLVSNPDEDLGDVSRPEETILWAPDSKAYALTSRVGTRHLATFIYRWDGKSFVRAAWKDDARLERAADKRVEDDMRKKGFSAEAGRGRILAGDSLAERWLDPDRIILRRFEESHVSEGDLDEVVSGVARALVEWDDASASYVMERELPIRADWPPRSEEDSPFEVAQKALGGDRPDQHTITVRHPETGERKEFEAENWLTTPIVLRVENNWPQIELVSRGPQEFQLRRLYQFVEGGYRCVRIDEMTRLEHQAPEGAPLVEIEPGFSLFWIRTRVPEPGAPDAYESFQTVNPAPDGKSRVVFTYTPQYLQRVEIVDADSPESPVNLYDFESGEGGVDTVCKILWSPDSQAFACYLVDGPRAGHTLLYRRLNGVWSQTAMGEIDYEFLKAGREKAIPSHRFEEPLWWNNPRELVLGLWGMIRGDDPIDYRAHSILKWDGQGKPLGSVSTPPWSDSPDAGG